MSMAWSSMIRSPETPRDLMDNLSHSRTVSALEVSETLSPPHLSLTKNLTGLNNGGGGAILEHPSCESDQVSTVSVNPFSSASSATPQMVIDRIMSQSFPNNEELNNRLMSMARSAMIRSPETPRDPMDNLSRSWTVSALEVSETLSPPHLSLTKNLNGLNNGGGGAILEDLSGESGQGSTVSGNPFSSASSETPQMGIDRAMSPSSFPITRASKGKQVKKKRLVKGKAELNATKMRRLTVDKKASELGTLCDVDVCMVILEPNGEIQCWPKDETLKVRETCMALRRKRRNKKEIVSDDSDHNKMEHPLSTWSDLLRAVDDPKQHPNERSGQFVRQEEELLQITKDASTSNDFDETGYLFDDLNERGGQLVRQEAQSLQITNEASTSNNYDEIDYLFDDLNERRGQFVRQEEQLLQIPNDASTSNDYNEFDHLFDGLEPLTIVAEDVNSAAGTGDYLYSDWINTTTDYFLEDDDSFLQFIDFST